MAAATAWLLFLLGVGRFAAIANKAAEGVPFARIAQQMGPGLLAVDRVMHG